MMKEMVSITVKKKKWEYGVREEERREEKGKRKKGKERGKEARARSPINRN